MPPPAFTFFFALPVGSAFLISLPPLFGRSHTPAPFKILAEIPGFGRRVMLSSTSEAASPRPAFHIMGVRWIFFSGLLTAKTESTPPLFPLSRPCHSNAQYVLTFPLSEVQKLRTFPILFQTPDPLVALPVLLSRILLLPFPLIRRNSLKRFFSRHYLNRTEPTPTLSKRLLSSSPPPPPPTPPPPSLGRGTLELLRVLRCDLFSPTLV